MDEANQIYADDNVTITKSLVKFRKASYPMNTIAGVYVAKPEGRAGIIFFGAIFIIPGLAWFGSGEAPQLMALLPVAIGAAIAAMAFRQPFSLRLETSAGSRVAYTSRKKAYLHELKGAIEKAVDERG